MIYVKGKIKDSDDEITIEVTDDKLIRIMERYGFSVYKAKITQDSEMRAKTKQCPICRSNVKDRAISVYKELIEALYEVYKYCGKHRKHEFEMKDIKSLLGKNEYARFGDLVRFGGIVYKPKDADGNSRKAWYGLNMKRARAFFAGEYDIPAQIKINQITDETIEKSERLKIGHFENLKYFLDNYGLYDYEKEV